MQEPLSANQKQRSTFGIVTEVFGLIKYLLDQNLLKNIVVID